MTATFKPFLLFTFLTSLFFSENLRAENRYILDRLITSVIEKSPQFNIIAKESESERLLNETELTVFDLSGSAEINYTDQKSPQTSPFSTRSANYLDYGLEFNKLWQSGVTTSVSYQVLDRENMFYNGANNSFIAPTLDFSVNTNLFQDLIGSRYNYLYESIREKNKTLVIQHHIDKKTFLKTLIKDFINVYISREEFRIQQSLCKSISSQFKIISKKRAKNIISRRDYLLGEKELKTCEIAISQYESSLFELESVYSAQYYSSVDGYIEKLNSLFSNIEDQVVGYKNDSSGIKIEDIDEVAVLNREQKALEFKQKELEAQNQIPLSLGISVGSTGLDNTLTPANQDISNLEFPYAKVSMKIDFPIVNRTVKNKSIANLFALEAIRQKKELTQSMIQSDYKTVSLNVSRDLETQIQFSQKLKLSQEILNEAQKDFKNGKIDYFELVEYQKSLLENQKELSDFRRETVSKIIQFLDYKQYFHQFIAGTKDAV